MLRKVILVTEGIICVFILLFGIEFYRSRSKELAFSESETIVFEELSAPSFNTGDVFINLDNEDKEKLCSIIKDYEYRYYRKIWDHTDGEKTYRMILKDIYTLDSIQLAVADTGLMSINNIEVSIGDYANWDYYERLEDNMEFYNKIDEFYNNLSGGR